MSNQEGYIPPEQYNSDCRLKPEDFSDVGQATVLATEYKDMMKALRIKEKTQTELIDAVKVRIGGGANGG